MSPSGAFALSRAATLTESPSTWNSRTTGPRMSPPTSSPVLMENALAHLQSGGGRRAFRALQGNGIAEDSHQLVAQVLVDRTAVLARNAVEQAQEVRHCQIGALGTRLRRERTEADHIREDGGSGDLFCASRRQLDAHDSIRSGSPV